MPRLASIFSTLAREGKPMNVDRAISNMIWKLNIDDMNKAIITPAVRGLEERRTSLESINAELVEALEIALGSVQWMADATDADPEDHERLAIVQQALEKARTQ